MRKMASIQIIRDITPIEGADAILLAHVNGWSSVVKVGEFAIGQKIIFCEIDSWMPHEIAPFLSKGKEPREYLGIKGERLRSVKLRGQLSQGLILPISILQQGSYTEGEDVSGKLGIVKYEPPVPVQLAGQVRGNFPSLVSKTDEERVQNIRDLEKYLDKVFVETENISSALLKRVEGKSLIDGKTIREGSVFRCFTDSSFSFKVVSNQFLLKGGD